MPHVAPTCNEKRRSDIEACASGIQKLATGTWRRELIRSPQLCLVELIISSRHFCVGSRRQHVVVFRGELIISSRQMHMAHISSPWHPCWWQSQARGARVQQKPYPHRSRGWPNSSAYCSSFLADCRQRDSGACVHGHRSWALCCIHEHAAQRLPRTLVALSCACATCRPYMQ